MTKDQHRKLLQAFEVDRLLKILAIEAKKHHDGHYTIFSCTTCFKVAFGTPDMDTGGGRVQLWKVKEHHKLKDAIIEALVDGRDFEGFFSEPFDIYKYVNGDYDDEGDAAYRDKVLNLIHSPARNGSAA